MELAARKGRNPRTELGTFCGFVLGLVQLTFLLLTFNILIWLVPKKFLFGS
jgi:hypothetical protein